MELKEQFDEEMQEQKNGNSDTNTPNDMDLNFRNKICASGLPFDQLLSGIQKAVRLEYYDELFWAVDDVIEFLKVSLWKPIFEKNDPEYKSEKNKISSAKAAVTNVIHRVMIMYLEDIHAGKPQLWFFITKQVKLLISLRTLNGIDLFKENLKLVLIAMAISPKSRFYSHVRKVWNDQEIPKEWMPEVLKIRQKLPVQFEKVKEYLSPESADKEISGFKDTHVDLKFWKKEIKNKEKWLINAAASIHENLMIINAREFENHDSDLVIIEKAKEIVEKYNRRSTIGNVKDKAKSIPDFFFSDYVVDKHTKKAKSLKEKGLLRFFLLGSNVTKERFLLHPDFHSFYTTINLYKSDIKVQWPCTIDDILEKCDYAREILNQGFDESRLFHFDIRPQITCSESRADTYYARLWGFPVFVKGPFLPEHQNFVLEQIKTSDLKLKLNGLSSLKPWKASINPNLWDKVPVGCRNKLNDQSYTRNKPQLFLIWKSLLTEWPIPYKNKKSNKWDEEIVDFMKIESVFVPNLDPIINTKRRKSKEKDISTVKKDVKVDPNQFKSFILACLWRYVMSVPDNAERNFLWIKDSKEVYSIDEDHVLHTASPSPFRYKETILSRIRKFIVNEKAEIQSTLKQWKVEISRFFKEENHPEQINVLHRLDQIIKDEDELLKIFTKKPKAMNKQSKDEESDENNNKKRKADQENEINDGKEEVIPVKRKKTVAIEDDDGNTIAYVEI